MPKVSPSLQRWLKTAGPTDRLTVIVRYQQSEPLDDFANELCRPGVDVDSCSQGVAVLSATRHALEELGNLKRVLAIDSAKPLHPF